MTKTFSVLRVGADTPTGDKIDKIWTPNADIDPPKHRELRRYNFVFPEKVSKVQTPQKQIKIRVNEKI
jgi:hypothetical protein